jgi:hypothetical protein
MNSCWMINYIGFWACRHCKSSMLYGWYACDLGKIMYFNRSEIRNIRKHFEDYDTAYEHYEQDIKRRWRTRDTKIGERNVS